jgi:hypothetical protein
LGHPPFPVRPSGSRPRPATHEDFNYHAYLYAADSHPHRTPTSGGAGIGSGLNSLSEYAYEADDFERAGWNSCQ